MIILFILVMILLVGGFLVFVAANAGTTKDEWLGTDFKQSRQSDEDQPNEP